MAGRDQKEESEGILGIRRNSFMERVVKHWKGLTLAHWKGLTLGQGGDEVTVPQGVQRMTGCGTQCPGLADREVTVTGWTQ